MYDIIVIGGGHAGVEAALASARLNNKTLMVVGSIKRISNMPCNPSIGGPAKGIIVREIDALGGEMAKATDATMLQIKMLNTSKGPAVRALRAQADKVNYPRYMYNVVQNTANLDVKELLVKSLLVENGTLKGIILENDEVVLAKSVIIASGTYLDSRILIGHWFKESGPDNEKTTSELSKNLKELGFHLLRLKTGTPPRVKKDSIDYSKMQLSPGDDNPLGFAHDKSYRKALINQVPCYLTYTNAATHQLIRDNLQKSSMYSGLIEGVGPRYCPSIEDKVIRFADKERHQIFIEPESLELDEMYIQGFSTSMPKEIQELMVHTLPGLENAVITKYAYAIEYDAIDPLELKNTLETKKISNLFFAGQVNGTSGYEEAACQGLIAGINASRALHNQEPLVLRRDEAYIGVLIDDLITKGVIDPYRMMTSRAEFRVLLRHDNAQQRLLKYGYDIGLVSSERYQAFLDDELTKETVIEKLKTIKITPKPQVNEYLLNHNRNAINEKITAYEFLKRNDNDFNDLNSIIDEKINLDKDLEEEILISLKYQGYINKAYNEAQNIKNLEFIKIPDDFCYGDVKNLSKEAVEKLTKIRPANIGQASRISGVNPGEIALLLVQLEWNNRGKSN